MDRYSSIQRLVISIFSPVEELGQQMKIGRLRVMFDAWSSLLDVTVNGNSVVVEGNGNFTSDEQLNVGIT